MQHGKIIVHEAQAVRSMFFTLRYDERFYRYQIKFVVLSLFFSNVFPSMSHTDSATCTTMTAYIYIYIYIYSAQACKVSSLVAKYKCL